MNAQITSVSVTSIMDFDEVPPYPESSNFWMITPTIALWFSSYDNRWRFMLLNTGVRARRSGESFETKEEAKEFYESGKLPTWVKASLVETSENEQRRNKQKTRRSR